MLLRLVRRTRPDVPPERQRDYLRFLAHGFRYGLWGGRALLTRRQAAAALRAEGLPPLPPSGTARYVQWLCLFRAWQRLKGG